MTPEVIDMVRNLAVIGLLGSLVALMAVIIDMLPEPHR